MPSAPKSLGRQLNFAASAGNAVCNQLLAPAGLTLAQWAILSCIWRNGPLGVKDMATLTGNAPSATSRIVERMVVADLLIRKQDMVDRRAVVIDVSKKGDALRKLQTIYEAVNSVLLSGLAPDEQEQLFDLLKRVEQNGRTWIEAHTSKA